MVLKVKDVAKLLNLSENAVRRMAQEGTLPSYRLNRSYCFSREEIEDFLMQRMMKETLQKETTHLGAMRFALFRAISRGGVLQLQGKNKEEIFRAAMQHMSLQHDIDAEMLCDLFLDREKLMPTALNYGLAVPHAREVRLHAPHDLILVVYPEIPLPYGALDGEPVHTLFFIFAIEDSTHLHLLAKLAHLASQQKTRDFLRTRPAKDVLLQHIKEWETALKH
jgi:nitrogen PTS system EIIA component